MATQLLDFFTRHHKSSKTAVVNYSTNPNSDSSVTYAELDDLSTHIQLALQQEDPQQQVPVGVICYPSIALIAAILGIFKAQDIYVPLDTSYPQRRISSILDLLPHLKVLLVQYSIWSSAQFNWLRGEVAARQITVVLLDDGGDVFSTIKNDTTTTPPKAYKERIAYIMFTSGTTGTPKSVHVPHECVVSNIVGLKDKWGVTEKDVILLASPIGFDPSIVDIFVCLAANATLVTLPPDVRSTPDLMCDAIIRHSVSILQVTPSHARRISNFVDKLRSVRILVLGGESILTKDELSAWFNKPTQVYNIYGVTEVSVWSMCHRVTEDDAADVKQGTLLGELVQDSLPDTECVVLDDNGILVHEGEGNLWTGGPNRICIVAGNIQDEQVKKRKVEQPLWEVKPYLRNTHDVVRVRNGRVWYVGRSDNLVKVLGAAVYPHEVSGTIREVQGVRAACVIPYSLESSTVLLAVVVPTTASNFAQQDLLQVLIRQHVHRSLPSHMWPFWVLFFASIADIPITPNGKIDQTSLEAKCKAMLDNTLSETVSEVGSRDKVIQIWKLALPHSAAYDLDGILERYFLTLGGSSLAVMWLVEKLIAEFNLKGSEEIRQEMSTTIMHNPLKDLIDFVMRLIAIAEPQTQNPPTKEQTPFAHVTLESPLQLGDILWSSGRAGTGYCYRCSSAACLHRISSPPPAIDSPSSGATVAWRVWLGKCVDSSPLVVARVSTGDTSQEAVTCYVGSHRGIILSVDAPTGNVLWSCDVGARVESSPAVSNDGQFVYVGGYDGSLFCLSCASGKIIWKYATGNQIKCSPYVDKQTNNIWIGSHDGCLYQLDRNGVCLYSFVANSAIFSSPTKNEKLNVIYFGAQDGHLFAISPQMQVLWKHLLGAPIFSSPTVDPQTGNIYCGCCNGCLYAFSSEGELLWKYQTAKPIYSSPCIPNSTSGAVLIGSHDGCLHCLTKEDGALAWRFLVEHLTEQVDSVVYSSPAAACLPMHAQVNIAVCNSFGSVYVLSSALQNEPKVAAKLQLTKGIFSSPVWLNSKQIVVGCRDNFLYCLNTGIP